MFLEKETDEIDNTNIKANLGDQVYFEMTKKGKDKYINEGVISCYNGGRKFMLAAAM